MELDLTGLAEIAKNGDPQKKGRSDSPCSDFSEQGEYKSTTRAEKPAEGQKTGLNKLQREADQNKSEKERTLAVYKEYQHNKIVTAQLQTELLKGTREGEDITELYLKAVKTISLLIHNELFYRQIAGDIEKRGQEQ